MGHGVTEEMEVTAFGRLGRPQVIAAAVLFLVSPLAAHVTGHVLVVDVASWGRREDCVVAFRAHHHRIGVVIQAEVSTTTHLHGLPQPNRAQVGHLGQMADPTKEHGARPC